jgi:hypothetical protein
MLIERGDLGTLCLAADCVHAATLCLQYVIEGCGFGLLSAPLATRLIIVFGEADPP